MLKVNLRRFDLRVAPTPIFGFKAGTNRLEVFEAAADKSHFLSLLPEKDDYIDSASRDGKIGFKHHIRIGLELSLKLGKEVQFHLDQANDPDERGTEQLLDVLEAFDQPKMPGGAPAVWIVHMISPSAYPEERFARLVARMQEQNVGVIVCPTAAVSMRQIRSLNAPVHNSIARMLELIKAKVPLRIGSDNICDVFVPQGDGDLLTEIKVGGHAARMAAPSIWAKLATGTTLNAVDIATVGRILHEDRKVCLRMDPTWRPAFE